MNNELSFADVMNVTIEAVKKLASDDGTKKEQVLRRLESLKGSEMNMYIIDLSMMKIREIAQSAALNALGNDECVKSLKKIELIADNMHNVGLCLVRGINVDAVNLLYKNWEKFSRTLPGVESLE